MSRFYFRIKLLVVVTGLLSSSWLIAAETQPAHKNLDRVIFLGNSFTYFNNSLHTHVANLMRAEGSYKTGASRYRAATISGGKLKEHAGSISLIKKNEWDAVVFHGHSTAFLTAKSTKEFGRYAKALVQYIRKQGAEPILLLTWPYKGKPEMLEPIIANAKKIAKLLKIRIIPAGSAFDKINKTHAQIDLYTPDLLRFEKTGDSKNPVQPVYKETIKHPSLSGTYLIACVVYSVLYGRTPEGSYYRAGLDRETAKTIQQTAFEVTQNFLQSNE